MKHFDLEPWEQEILNDFERGEFVSLSDTEKTDEYKEIFSSFFDIKDKP